jgi:integral membrane protein (TIGR01906 family)
MDHQQHDHQFLYGWRSGDSEMKLSRIASIIIAIIVPFFLLLGAVRVMFNPAFLGIEYRAPGFPPDQYGFNLQDRLKWGNISLDYLFNDQGISFLADQRLDANTSLYNERELSHMLDVKNLIQKMYRIWYVVIAFLVVCGLLAWRGKWLKDFWIGISNGGFFTLALLLGAFLGIFLNFDWLFTQFHHLFFTGDTWLFLYSDTLIRLFPMRLWQDAFIGAGGLTALCAILCLVLGRRLAKK